MNKKILVWDLPTRLGHWLLVGAFATAWLTSEGESWKNVHVAAGSLMVAVVAFRLAWGLIGSRWARFASFVYPPRAVFQYLAGVLRRQPIAYTGHNPASAYAIFVLLLLTLLTAATGWAAYNELGDEAVEEAHQWLANGMLVVIAAHISGVFLSSITHHENLARSMVDGIKSGPAGDAISGIHAGAALVLAALAGAAVWLSRFL